MIGAPGIDYENKVVGEEGMLLFTPGIADCIAVGIVELNTMRTNAIRMSMVHFKSGDYKDADFGPLYLTRLLNNMNPENVYVVIASSNCNAGFTGRKQYKKISKRLINRGVHQANILCYEGKHNSSIKFAISSDLTFGECEINQHAATLAVRQRQTGCCVLS